MLRVGVAMAAAVVLLTSASAASAHGDDGVFTGTEATPGEGLNVNVRARLVYANDDDPAPGALMTVDAVDAAGTSTPPALLNDNRDGTYEGTLALPRPGAYTLRFNATTPNATTEVSYTAPEPASTTTTAATATTGSSGNSNDNDDGGGGPGMLVIVAIVVLVTAGVGWVLWRQWSRPRP